MAQIIASDLEPVGTQVSPGGETLKVLGVNRHHINFNPSLLYTSPAMVNYGFKLSELTF